MNVVTRRRNGIIIEHTIDGIQQPLSVGRDSVEPTPRSVAPPKPKPIEPQQPWPLALLPLKLLAKSGDRGAGDIIARVIGPIGGDAFKSWYKKIFGKSCGCGNRRETLNARFPL